MKSGSHGSANSDILVAKDRHVRHWNYFKPWGSMWSSCLAAQLVAVVVVRLSALEENSNACDALVLWGCWGGKSGRSVLKSQWSYLLCEAAGRQEPPWSPQTVIHSPESPHHWACSVCKTAALPLGGRRSISEKHNVPFQVQRSEVDSPSDRVIISPYREDLCFSSDPTAVWFLNHLFKS